MIVPAVVVSVAVVVLALVRMAGRAFLRAVSIVVVGIGAIVVLSCLVFPVSKC